MEQTESISYIDPRVGLTSQEAAQRVPAGAAAQTGLSEKEIVLKHCFTFFNGIFLVLAAALVVARSSVMNMGFLVVAAINTVIGILQEIRAKRAVDRLTLVAQRPVKVLRDASLRELPQEALVRDDIAQFAQGDTLPADGILREGELWLDESLITGEADAVTRGPGDRVQSGSVVLAGRGLVQLTHVGAESFAARLSQEAKGNPGAKKSEMMRSLDRLILAVGIALVPVGVILFYQEFSVLGLGFRASTEGTVAALVGMIPEGLYLLTSVAMAASALKLSRRRVLVRDMNCIESLARVDVLCVDKTGTITEPDMEVENIEPLSDLEPEYLEAVLNALYGGREPDNATARAIHELFPEPGDWVETKYIPFSPEYKWSGAVFEGRGAFLAGAPEFLLGPRIEEYRQDISDWTGRGSRVLLVAAYGGDPVPGALDPAAVTPLALVILSGRIREKAPETFRYFQEQGVSLRVISGDDPRTVSQIALRAEIPGADRLVDASTLETDEDFLRAAREGVVFGRVTPEQKRRLVAALQAQGHTVAMTGDGVNDLLAMKQADCSVAMASGAQAASQLASLVLLDSDFAAMPGIVAEGRRVINNIQRAATLFLVKNIFSLFLSVISLFTDWPYPLQPMHLTVISALTIGIPSFFLALEPNHDLVTGHFMGNVLRKALPGGLTGIAVILYAELFSYATSITMGELSTICVALMTMNGLTAIYYAARPLNKLRSALIAVMAVTAVVCMFTQQTLFNLTPLSLVGWLILVALLVMVYPFQTTLHVLVEKLRLFVEKLRAKQTA